MAGEAYTKRYAGGFLDFPNTSTPEDAAFLNAVETALLRLLGEDPAQDEVPVWSPGSGRFVFQKVTNAQIDAAAAIDKSKLAALNIGDADVAAAANIAGSKLSDGSIARAKLATVTRKAQCGVQAASVPPQFADATTTTITVWVIVPDDYDSGSITLQLVLRPSVASGTAKMQRAVYRSRAAATLATIESTTAFDFTTSTGNAQQITSAVTAANFQAGDVLRWDYTRLGADAGDTLAGLVTVDGAWVEYTGRA